MERELVGTQIPGLVDDLAGIKAAREFCFVQLSAPSGSGKSRTVREFYRSLVASQSDPGYWPTELVFGEGLPSLDPLPSRKILGPPHGRFEAPPGALPDFLWVSVACCRQGDGRPVEGVHQISRQLDLHA